MKPRYKIVKHKKKPLCDYLGECKNLAFREVYKNLGKSDSSWSYLCRKHFSSEKKRLKGKIVFCGLD